MTLRTRVAIVGLGSMGRNHLRVLSAMPELDVVAVCDTNSEQIPSGPWEQLTDYRDAADEFPDYCVIASPTLTHLEIATHFIGQGVPILVEKPLASTTGEARAIFEAAQAEGSKVAVGMIERFNQTAIELRRILESNQFGRLVGIHTRRIGPPPGRDMGTGVTLDLGIHDLDLVQWLTSERIANAVCRNVSSVVSPYEDLVIVSGVLTCGAICHSEVSWISPTKERTIELTFSSARVKSDLIRGEVSIAQQDESEVFWDKAREFRGVRSAVSRLYFVKNIEPLTLMHESLRRAVASSDWSSLPSARDAVDLHSLIDSLKTR